MATMDVWLVPLRIDGDTLRRAFELLDAGERARARRLQGPCLRRRFIAAHAALRRLLGARLQRSPASLRLHASVWGKPALDLEPRGEPLHFNLSHSGELALVALSPAGPVGVDVETLAQATERAPDLAWALSPLERHQLAALPWPQRALATYRCWTRKEALLKAVGCGIGQGLDRFTVSCDESPRLLASEHPQLATHQWALHGREYQGQWVAAVAAPAHGSAPAWHHWHWGRV